MENSRDNYQHGDGEMTQAEEDVFKQLPEAVRQRVAKCKIRDLDGLMRLSVWALSQHPDLKPGVTFEVDDGPEEGTKMLVANDNGVRKDIFKVSKASDLGINLDFLAHPNPDVNSRMIYET